MTSDLFLLFLYGMCAWGAGLNTPAWVRLVWRRWREPGRTPPWWNDTIMLARMGITILAFGACGLAGVRTLAALFDRVPLAVPSPIGMLFIGSMAAAEPLFLRVDEIHARARGSWSLGWRLYWAGAVAWCVVLAEVAILPDARRWLLLKSRPG